MKFERNIHSVDWGKGREEDVENAEREGEKWGFTKEWGNNKSATIVDIRGLLNVKFCK